MSSLGKGILRYLKEVAGMPGPQVGLKVAEFPGYFLRPVATRPSQLDSADIACLTEWRNQNTKAFLTEFRADEERTAKWLCETVHDDDGRILFMIENEHNDRVGYMGIAYVNWANAYVEADAIVRGGDAPKGLMSASLMTLLGWARGQLGLNTVAVRVISDNPALAFYRKLGFVELKRVPLRRIQSFDSVNWEEDNSISQPERFLVHHRWANEI